MGKKLGSAAGATLLLYTTHEDIASVLRGGCTREKVLGSLATAGVFYGCTPMRADNLFFCRSHRL